MTFLTFQTVLRYGDDRGSARPVNLYQVDLPAAEHKSYLDAVTGAYVQALENIVGDIDYQHGYWVEGTNEYLDETELMLRRDRYPANEQPITASTDPAVAADALLKDTLTSQAWEYTFGEEDHIYGRTLKDLIKTSKQTAKAKQVTTKRIPLGTPVYYVHSRNLNSPALQVSIFQGSDYEEHYVPVDFADADTSVIESYPLPFGLDKRNRWFARVKSDKKLETVARLRADAIRGAHIKAAHAAYWQ